MAKEENHQITFNALTSTLCLFDDFIASYEIYSEDAAMFVKEDDKALGTVTATSSHHRVPKNTIHESVIPCRAVGVLGDGAGGTAHVKAIPLRDGISDLEVERTRQAKR